MGEKGQNGEVDMVSMYTPGPWKAKSNNPAETFSWMVYNRAHSNWPIAVDMKEADAYLIAAAPDLLQACKDLVALLDSNEPIEVGCHCTDSGNGPVKCAWCKAKDVLKKAERRNKADDKKPECFIPEKDVAYPLCIGNRSEECKQCCLYRDMEDEGGYSWYDR